MRRLLLVIALVLGFGASVARADNGYFYIGAGISKDKLSDIGNQGTNFADIDKTSWKAYAGFRPLSVVAVEADYIDLGSDSNNFSGTSSHAKAFAGYGVGFLPIPLPWLDVFGKAGVARWKLDGSAPSASFSTSGTEFAWGVGTQAHLGNFGARLEYEHFDIPGTSGAKITSLEVFLNIF